MPCSRKHRFRPKLVALEQRDVPTGFVEVETNNTAASANSVTVPSGAVLSQPSVDWLTIEAAINSNSDRDFFRFSLSQPATVFFDVNANETGLSFTLNAVVDVYDAAGTTVLASSDAAYDPIYTVVPNAPAADATSADPWLPVDLPAGTFLVRVTSFLNATSGNYELRMLADPTMATAPLNFASRPGAAVTLYLDFDGHAASDEWGTYAATAFDFNSQPSLFSPAEQWSIQTICRIVAEDFVPFEVNVSTVDPGQFPNGFGYRVVITNSAPTVVGQSASARGAAFLGSFVGPGINTGFVFAGSFGDFGGGMSGRVTPTAIELGNEISRQFARAVGLRNFGGTNGQPAGILQTPDFGFNREIWSSGMTHSGEAPIVLQDDMAALNTLGTIPFRADDHGDTLATATVTASASIDGIIGDRVNDRDLIRIAANQGDYLIRLMVDPHVGNLDAKFRFLDAAGQVLIAEAPANSFGMERTIYVPATADYYLEISSDGDAGEVGSYRLEYSFSPVVTPARVTAVVVNNGATQRSRVSQVELRFSRPLTFPNGTAAAFLMNGPNGLADMTVDLTGSTASQTLVTLRFPNGPGGSLSNGLFDLTLSAANILDDAGNMLDGDGNGQAGGDFHFILHRLFGDFDGNRTVNSADFASFRTVFGVAATSGLAFAADANGDGVINAQDFGFFRGSFGVTL